MNDKRRQQDREILVSFPVGVQLDDCTFMETQITDCTTHGAFVQCPLSKAPPIGATILLLGEYRKIPYRIEAVVRWKGKSATHRIEGFGIEFTHEPTAFRKIATASSVIPSMPAPIPY